MRGRGDKTVRKYWNLRLMGPVPYSEKGRNNSTTNKVRGILHYFHVIHVREGYESFPVTSKDQMKL